MKRLFNRRTLGCIALALVLFSVAFIIWWMEILPAREKGINAKLSDDYTIYTSAVEQSVHQEFFANQPLYALGFVFGIEGEQPQGELELTLSDALNNEILAQSSCDMSTVIAGQYTVLSLDESIINSDGDTRQYIINLIPHYSGTGRLTVGCSEESVSGFSSFCVNDEQQPGAMALLATVDKIGDFISTYYFMVVVALILIVCGAFWLCNGKLALHKLYFGLVLSLGLVFCAVLPPYSAPDEAFHIEQAFSLASSITDKLSVGVDDDGDVYSLTETDTLLQNQKTTVFTWREYIDKMQNRCESGVDYNLHEQLSVGRYRWLYAIGAVGVVIGVILHLNFALTLLLGRFANLLVFALSTGYAVKKAPFGKRIFAVVGLLPMCLHLAASFSYDCLILSAAFLFTSLCLDAAYGENEKPGWKQLLALTALGIFIAPSKMVYLPLIALVFIIPAKRLTHSKAIKSEFLALCIISFLIGGASTPVQIWISDILNHDAAVAESEYTSTTQSDETGSEQLLSVDDQYREMDKVCYSLNYILTYPGQTIQLAARSAIKLGSHYVKTLVGGNLSYYSVDVSWIWVVALYLILFWSMVPQQGELGWSSPPAPHLGGACRHRLLRTCYHGLHHLDPNLLRNNLRPAGQIFSAGTSAWNVGSATRQAVQHKERQPYLCRYCAG